MSPPRRDDRAGDHTSARTGQSVRAHAHRGQRPRLNTTGAAARPTDETDDHGGHACRFAKPHNHAQRATHYVGMQERATDYEEHAEDAAAKFGAEHSAECRRHELGKLSGKSPTPNRNSAGHPTKLVRGHRA
jgi:hypothetical protein